MLFRSKRLHVHVAVENLEKSIRFYSALFAATPTKVETDYAKWMMDEPAVNFAISQRGAAPGIDHLGLQTDDEAELIGWLHRAQDERAAVVLNPAAFTHYSYALRDACAMLTTPLVEVHISNPAAREEFRHTSVVSAVATGTIAGFGVDSYRLALDAMVTRLRGKR